MAISKRSTATKQRSESEGIDVTMHRAPSREEKRLLEMYRQMSRWEKKCVFLLIQSISWGQLTPKTDRLTFNQLWRTCTR